MFLLLIAEPELTELIIQTLPLKAFNLIGEMSGKINVSLFPLCFIMHSIKQLLCSVYRLVVCFVFFFGLIYSNFFYKRNIFTFMM